MKSLFRKRAMRTFFSSVVFAFVAACAQAQTTASELLPDKVMRLAKANGIPVKQLGLYVAAADGKPLVAHNMDKLFNPASAIKLVVTQAALDILGPHHTWKSQLRAAAPVSGGELRGDLYFIGSGDPSITYERLLGLISGLRLRGIERINGSVIIDDTLFEVPRHDPGAFDGAGARPYNGAAGAAMVGFGSSRIVVRNGTEGIVAFSEPASTTFVLDNQLVSVRSRCRGNWRGRIRELLHRKSDGSARLELKGRFPSGCGELSFYILAHDDPAAHLAGAIQGNFEMLGGNGNSSWRRGKVPQKSSLLSETESPPLIEALIGMNKHSNNIMARNIFLSLAQDGGIEPYTPQAANKAVAAWMEKNGIASEGLLIENGSGLSRTSRITTRQFAEVLRLAVRSPLYAELTATLPILGIDGTTRKWLRRSDAAGNVHIKTGTLRGVRTAAGFVHTSSGRDLLFVCMIEWGNTAAGRKLIQDLLAWAHEQGDKIVASGYPANNSGG